jgi:hypothetical protein
MQPAPRVDSGASQLLRPESAQNTLAGLSAWRAAHPAALDPDAMSVLQRSV